jgi:hypothetical protein
LDFETLRLFFQGLSGGRIQRPDPAAKHSPVRLWLADDGRRWQAFW